MPYLSDQELAALQERPAKPARPRLSPCQHIYDDNWMTVPGELLDIGNGVTISQPAWGQFRRFCTRCGKGEQRGRGDEYGRKIEPVGHSV